MALYRIVKATVWYDGVHYYDSLESAKRGQRAMKARHKVEFPIEEMQGDWEEVRDDLPIVPEESAS